MLIKILFLYKEKALRVHVKVCHLRLRDFACAFEGCDQTFGYKHLLQRHVAKAHAPEVEHSDTMLSLDEFEKVQQKNRDEFNIDVITGNAYAKQAEEATSKVRCPYPELTGLLSVGEIQSIPGPSVALKPCDFVFSRAYDLRRHLNAFHGADISKEGVDAWMKIQKKSLSKP